MGILKDFMKRFRRVEATLDDMAGIGCRVIKAGANGKGLRILVDGYSSDEVPKPDGENNNFLGPAYFHKCDADMFPVESEGEDTDHNSLSRSLERHLPEKVITDPDERVFTPHDQLYQFDTGPAYDPCTETQDIIKLLARSERQSPGAPDDPTAAPTLRYVQPGKAIPGGQAGDYLGWDHANQIWKAMTGRPIAFIVSVNFAASSVEYGYATVLQDPG